MGAGWGRGGKVELWCWLLEEGAGRGSVENFTGAKDLL